MNVQRRSVDEAEISLAAGYQKVEHDAPQRADGAGMICDGATEKSC